ncbi:MAG TPA: hypothetical protein VM617_06265 [Thermoanaerobaculia bacterium]|nr:hypothetical protein [Thermoanaerobaculia bacterium]
MNRAATTLFREEQRFRQPWLWSLIALATALEVTLAVVLLGAGTARGLVVLAAALLLPVLLALLTLRTEVRPDGLHLRFWPLVRHRHLRPEEIVEATARTYRPIVEYGGWGLRFGSLGTAYNTSGNRGVQLLLASGRRLLIGSQRADELAAAIDAMRGRGAG